MADLVIPNDLAQEIETLAKAQNQTVEQYLRSLVRQANASPVIDDQYEANRTEARKRILRKLYPRARAYWQQVGNTERLALTDEQLDNQFWLFDADGIPRLKSEQGTIDIPNNSLLRFGEAIQSAAFRSGKTDTAERSREILNSEFADYLTSRIRRNADDTE